MDKINIKLTIMESKMLLNLLDSKNYHRFSKYLYRDMNMISQFSK